MSSSFAWSISLQPTATPPSAGSALGASASIDGYAATDGDLQTWVFAASKPRNSQPRDSVATQMLRHSRLTGLPDTEFLRTLDGPFAIVLANRRTGDAYLAVDRIGQGTLYFAVRDGSLHFGPRMSDVVSLLGTPAKIRRQSILDYVYFHNIPAPQTIYEGVHKVERGTLVAVSATRQAAARYWVPSFQDAAARASPEAMRSELLTVLESSVARAREEPSAGAFLSGGLDSSTIVAMLARSRNPSPSRAVSMGFSAEGYDEIRYARIAAEHFGVPHTVHYVTASDIAEHVRGVAAGFDEPFGNSSALPTFVCARVAREAGITQLLAGDGGDELFGGNERYAHQLIFEDFNARPAVLRGLVQGVVRAWPEPERLDVPVIRKARSFLEQCATPLPDRLQRYNFLNQIPAEDVFEPSFLRDVDPGQPLSQLQRAYREPERADAVDRMLYLDWKFTLQDNDLVKVNTACRLAGVRVAYPMLSNDVIDFSCRLPADWKTRRGELRWFYKRAMRGVLPQPIIDKTKHGFGLPFGVWLRDDPALAEIAENSVGSLKHYGWFRPEFLDRVLAMHRAGHASYYGELVWILMTLGIWLDSRADGAAG